MAKSKKSAKGTKGKVGRPRIEFDLEAVEGLGKIGATAAEMAAVLPASQSTIEHRLANKQSDFSKAYEKGRSLLNSSLRRKQIQVAMSGNTTMLIWLGKQLLGQSDAAAVEVRTPFPEAANALEEAQDVSLEEALEVLGLARPRKKQA